MTPSPGLRIETANLDALNDSVLPSLLAFKPLRIPASPNVDRPSVDHSKKRLNESRKLLSHILAQLQLRPMPPTVYDMGCLNFGTIADTVKGVVRGDKPVATSIEDHSGDTTQPGYSTDYTFELMNQLRDIFVYCVEQKWKIFEDGTSRGRADGEGSKIAYAFRKTRPSLHRNRSRSSSPVRESYIQASELLLQCISVLASVVQEECRYKVTAARPLRPPNGLHAVCLDVARFLINSCRHDPQLMSYAVRAMIPAFSTFPREMQATLLRFFEECIVWSLIQDLRTLQTGNAQAPSEDPFRISKEDEDKATVRIQIQDVEQAAGDEDHLFFPELAILSTYAPSQSRSIYSLASIVPLLLSAILENIDMDGDENRPELHERLRRVLISISMLKFDACIDLLQVVAYHTQRARLFACTVLTSLWYKAVGHTTISAPLADMRLLPNNSITPNSSHLHQFVPWRFSVTSRSGNTSQTCCHVCANVIVGFSLMCYLCMCSVHFNCYDYPQGCSLIQYSPTANHEDKKTAVYRFCYVQSDGVVPLPHARTKGHNFQYFNLFTLSLCFQCRKPLWGCFSQGVGCRSCSTFFHPACFPIDVSDLPFCDPHIVNFSHLAISWESLRSTCINHYKDILSANTQGPQRLSYEEISIYLGLLRMQMQILTGGISLGTVIIIQNGRTLADVSRLDSFELHNAIQQYQSFLESNDTRSSQALDDYLFENHLHRREHNLMFDWSCLSFISTAIRGPCFPTQTLQQGTPGLLSVSHVEPIVDGVSSEDPFYNMVSLSHIRGVLEHVFNMTTEPAIRFFVQYLTLLGFIQTPHNSNLHTDHDQSLCSFTLPFGFGSSVEVEILVSAIEACLSDENLSINEFGFLLLTRRLSPNGMSSEYALRRLARSVVAWILTEDSAVVTILRDFVAKRRHLPGVPPNSGLPAWPEGAVYRSTATSPTNGGDYIALRRALHSRYAAVWLLILHDQDPVLYAEVVYDSCADFVNVEAINTQESTMLPPGRHESSMNGNILQSIIKLSQFSVVYSVFDKLIYRWMESASTLKLKEPLVALHKIFNLERGHPMRFSISSDSAMTDLGSSETIAVDPWRPILDVAGRRGDELARSLGWLNLLASGGVQIPGPHFLRFVHLISEENNLVNAAALINAAFKNAWLNPIARQDIPFVVSKLHVSFSSSVISAIQNSQGYENVWQLIRQSLASCLLVFGCDRKKVTEIGMITEGETHSFPLRRKANNRQVSPPDPITIDAGLMHTLGLYTDTKDDEITSITAKFFNAFLTDSPFMEAYEVDNFVLRNGKVLAKSAWQLYGIQRPDLYEIRANLLFRTIVVDSQPFHDICHNSLLPTVSWEGRLSAVTRLFRIVLDITNPASEVEGRHWRSSITVALYFFFKALWMDDKEEVRLAVRTSALTLRLAHQQAMQLCWAELLSTAPIEERVRLASFLYHLLSYFPDWEVLSWREIMDALSECEGNRDSDSDGDRDVTMLRVSLLLLGLQMIANGTAVSASTLLKIKKHLVDLVGFANAITIRKFDGQISRIEFGGIETISEDAIPCIDELAVVFDSHCPFELAPSMMTAIREEDDKATKLLVGSLFIDVVLVMFCTLEDLLSLPVLTLKRVLESLCIMVYKHNFESPPLIHLQHRLRQAASRVLELVLQDISYELRQIALSFIQAFIKQCGQFMGTFVYKAIEQLAKFIAAESRHPSDGLIIQARSFLEETLAIHASNGLFANLLKRPLPREFFVVLKQIFDSSPKDTQTASNDLKNALLHDVMTRAVDFDRDGFQAVLRNLSTYVETVHNEGYNSNSMMFVGQQLILLARRASGDEQLDPSPLFTIPAVLCENDESRMRDIIPYVQNEIRIILSRSLVAFDSLFRLLCATQTFQRRNGSLIFANGIAPIIFEVLADGLRSKAKVQPFTLTNLVQVVVYDESPEWLPLVVTYPTLFLGLIDNSVHFLLTHEWLEAKLEDSFNASLSAARLIWRAIDDDVRMTEKLVELGSEKTVSVEYRIRAWNVMTLVALQYPDKRMVATLFPYLSMISEVQFRALRAYIDSEPAHWDQVTANINHAYIAIKLWILLAGRITADSAEGELATARVWNALWPPFESLAFNVEKQTHSHPTLALLITSSVADLFIILHSLPTPLSLQTAVHISTLERLKSTNGIDAASKKISRTISTLSQPPSPQPFDMLVDQASKDIIAAEKLRVLECKKEIGRAAKTFMYQLD